MKKIKEEEKKEEQAILVSPIVELAAPLEKLVEQSNAFHVLKGKLLNIQDYQEIQGKKYIKKSGWRKIALAFNITDEITKEERREGQGYFVWDVTVRAIAPNGRSSMATASCASNEKRFSHLEHDVRATACTRAKNRAISDLVGGGEVSAEEISGDDQLVAAKRPQTPRNTNGGPVTVRNPQDPVTPAQIKMLIALAREAGYDEEQLKAKIKIQSFNDLKKGEISKYIETLKKKVDEIKTNGGVPTVQVDEPPQHDGELQTV